LAKNKEWHDKVNREVQDTANRYSPDSTLPLKDRLMHVPLEAWESEFRAIDLCLKETIRLQMSGCAFRYNRSNKDIPLGGSSGEVIPQGAFVAMAAGDMHYNSDIYTHPDEWDPSRYLPGRAEDKKQAYSWMGWGLARHPCLGVRFAKLENNLVVAFFLAYFSEFELTDKRGSPIGCVPACDRDNYTPRKPTQGLCLKLKDR
jgi:cytochrome P450